MEATTLTLEADYLVIGCGATAMAFVDELIHTSPASTFVIVDKHARPGGHWNNAYEFIKLHQPAELYGVNSKQLGRGGNDLVTRAEIHAYYECVMKQFLESGVVKFFPLCEYKGNDVFVSLMQIGLQYKVKVRKKTVDATYMAPSVPSVKEPEFKISNGVNLVPINGLSRNQSAWKRYVIIGSGKTGIDAVLFLLEQNVDPDRITWIIPNDCWYTNRTFFYTAHFTDSNIKIMNCIMGCENYNELYKRWESVGFLFRLDNKRDPTVFRGASVTLEEIQNLRLISNVIRKGRIDYIKPGRIVFKNGSEIEIDQDILYVDCSANGTGLFVPKNIFQGREIFLQTVVVVEPLCSAALIAAFENRFPDNEKKKNEILKPLARPQSTAEFIVGLKNNFHNEDAIEKELGIGWFRRSRLSPIHHISLVALLRFTLYMKWNGKKILKSLEMITDNIKDIQ